MKFAWDIPYRNCVFALLDTVLTQGCPKEAMDAFQFCSFSGSDALLWVLIRKFHFAALFA